MFAGAALRPCTIRTTTGEAPSGCPASTTGCPSWGCISEVVHGCKAGFDLGAERLFPGRQLERAPERRQVLVHGEARLDGRHLEEDAPWLPKVDRLEITTVAHLGHAESGVQQILAEPKLPLRRGNRHRDMVDRPEAIDCGRRLRILDDVDEVTGGGAACRDPRACAVARDEAIAEHAGQQ